MNWRYKALAISFVANVAVAASVPILGLFSGWLLIPGAYPAFWLCNSFEPGCKGRYENAAWIVGWFLNVIFCWLAIWAAGLLRKKR